jgi:hypothetical protein
MNSLNTFTKKFLIEPEATILLHPSNENYSLRKIISSFILFDIILILINGVLFGLVVLIYDDFHSLIKSNSTLTTSIYMTLKVMLLAPLIEEFGFRLSLILNRFTASISLGIQIGVILQLIFNLNYPMVIRLIFMLVVAGIIYLLLNKHIVSLIKKHHRLYIYYNILFFGFLHITNYELSSTIHYFLIPVLIFQNVFFGAYLSFLRMTYGFKIALLMHLLHNSFFGILSYLALLYF